MLNTLAKITQKPSDKNIRNIRILFACILIIILIFGHDVTRLNFGIPSWIYYGLYIFPIIGLIRGIFDPGLWRKAIWKWVIVGLGLLMMILSIFVLDDMVPVDSSSNVPMQTASGVSLSDLTAKTTISQNFSLSTDNWFGFFGGILIIIGFLLNGKNITTKNERYGEKVTKIRV